MKDSIYTVKENKPLTSSVYMMTLKGDTENIRPGQFVNIKLPQRYLRRPISVYDVSDDELTLIYKVVGHGTDDMSKMDEGIKLQIMSELGNGYDLSLSGKKPLLIGGGVGVPPLYYLAKKLIEEGKKPYVILGFNTKEEIFGEEEFRKLGIEVAVTTVDGSYGIKGFVTDALPENYTYVYTCGPLPMLKAVYDRTDTSGQYSFEARMGCGYGACMGCSTPVKNGYKRVCKDGPIFYKEEIVW
ncbi:MAG: dihydroorotate dehydrogenase electron transfer subunit [Erysipelotrichaceae bacterium]|nr:dihydroorotate dehydrogenase electron transfer subunit [Erysipelotrichaceae bacterium]